MIRVLQTVSAAYPTNSTVPALLPRSDGQIRLQLAKLLNVSGSSSDLGIFRNISSAPKFVGGIVGTTLTDSTAAIAGGASTQILSTSNNDGFLVGCNEAFGLVGFTVSQAESGSPVYTYKYWNGASFATLNTQVVPTSYATSPEQLIIFMPPIDWVKGGAITSVTGIDQNKFHIYVKATTGPGTAVKVSKMWIGEMIDYAAAVANNGSLEWKVSATNLAKLFESGDGLLPFFGVAGVKNSVFAQYLAQDS